MPATIEDTVKVDGVEFPASGDGGNVFIEAGDEGNVSGARLCRDSRVRYAKGSMLKYARAQIRRERSWY